MRTRKGHKPRKEHLHINISKYLMDYLEEQVTSHSTSYSHEIEVSVLLRMLNK